MHRLRQLAIAGTVVAVWLTPGTAALAANAGGVQATVTVATPCITVSPVSVDFGTLGFSPDNGAPAAGFQGLSYTNCGASAEQIFGRGTDAHGPGGTPTWSLDPTPGTICPARGLNNYRLGVQSTLQPTLIADFTTTDQAIETVAANANGLINRLYIHMPCAGSSGAGVTMTFQATFTATF